MANAPQVGWWPRLVTKFRDLSDEPTSRRTVVLMEFALVAQVALSLLAAAIMQVRVDVFDQRQLLWWLGCGVAVEFVCLALAWLPARRGREGRWTAYVVVLGFGAWLAAIGIATGNSVVVGWMPLAVVLVAVWYDVAVGVVGGIYTLLLLGAGVLVTNIGVIPYAPLTHGRDLDWHLHLPDAVISLLGLLGGFAYALGLVCLANAARAAQKRDLMTAHKLVSRYAPAQVVTELAAGRGESLAAPRRARLTVVFSDIVGFTDAADELDPEALTTVLNEYLAEMATIAHAHDGTVEQFVGDAVMVFFGAPVATTDEDHALRAIRMSLAMQRRLAELQAEWASRGIRLPFQSRIGVNTGHASVGDFGSDDRSVYGAVGLQVNIAARIQAQCEPGKVLISETTRALVQQEIACTPRGELTLKGVHFPVRVFEVVAA